MDPLHVILWGCVGGALPDIIRIIKSRTGDFPKYFRSFWYWFGFLLLIALGGFVAWLGSAHAMKEALAFGYAGPEALSRLLGVKDSGQVDRGDEPFNLRRFWSN